MAKPSVFIGSSLEGLSIAEAVFMHLEHETIPKLWTNKLFTPGSYPLDILENKLKKSSFAVLIASPDDEITKRGATLSAMRDNILFEFGLFAGALGRRRAFFICPSNPPIGLPSDLFGIIHASYDATRVAGGIDERAAAVQTACHEIKGIIHEEWASIQQAEAEHLSRIRASRRSLAVKRLYTVAVYLRDALIVVQRDAIAALSNREKFEQAKVRAINEVDRIIDEFNEDAKVIGLVEELEHLRVVTNDALVDLPFPQELSYGDADTQQAINMGVEAFNVFMRGGSPVRHVRDASIDEARERILRLSARYSDWWDKHGTHLRDTTMSMQDSLFDVLIKLSSEQYGIEMSL
ncbi:MAG: nucleotide-binding protein [Rhodospirillales bacterium]